MRVYTVAHEITSLNPAAGDGLLIVENANDQVLEVIRAALYNMNITTQEILVAGVFRVATKGSLTGGGAAPTPVKANPGDTASACTIYEAGASGMATEPTAWGDRLDEQGQSNIAGYEWEPPFDSRPIINPSGLFGLRLMKVPAAAFNAKILITYGEIGG